MSQPPPIRIEDVLRQWRGRIERSFDDGEGAFDKEMRALWAFLRRNNATSSYLYQAFEESARNARIAEFQRFFTRAQNIYERSQELHEIDRIVADRTFGVAELRHQLAVQYHREILSAAESEVEKSRKLLGVGELSRAAFVMVGCGIFAVSLLNFSIAFPQCSCIGIDSNAEAILVATRLRNRLQLSNIRYELCDGVNFDYREVGTVLVANFVRGKASVLRRIAHTARPGLPVMLRLPVGFGALFYEPISIAQSGLEFVAVVSRSAELMNETVLLRTRMS